MLSSGTTLVFDLFPVGLVGAWIRLRGTWRTAAVLMLPFARDCVALGVWAERIHGPMALRAFYNHSHYFLAFGFWRGSGGTGGVGAGFQQSLCCHRFVAALIMAFDLVGSTGLLQFGQTNETPISLTPLG